MQVKITRSTADDSLYAVSDENRTRPMRTAELVKWLHAWRVDEGQIASVLDLAPAGSVTLDLEDQSPGHMARAS